MRVSWEGVKSYYEGLFKEEDEMLIGENFIEFSYQRCQRVITINQGCGCGGERGQPVQPLPYSQVG